MSASTLGTSGISDILKDVHAQGEQVLQNEGNEKARQELLESARRLVAELEPPFETVGRMAWFELTRLPVVRVAFDIKLFESIMADNASPKSTEKLAEMTGCDPVLLSRFLKHLLSSRFVKETEPNVYTGNAMTAALSNKIAQGTIKNCYDHFCIMNDKMCEFLKKTNYQNPTDKDASLFMYAKNTNLHFFDYLKQPGNEEQLQDMANHMDGKTLARPWHHSSNLDVPGLFDNPTDPEAVLMIDVGGSSGHDIINFHKFFPDLPGRLILQDLPSTIDVIPPDTLPPAISAQGYDFFTPQPIKGAKVYYLHHVLHDWPDDACRKILGNVKDAMTPGYSKILLNEIVIKEQGAEWFATSLDMLVMFTHSAHERMERQWRELVESAGLRVERIWDADAVPEKIIEVVLA